MHLHTYTYTQQFNYIIYRSNDNIIDLLLAKPEGMDDQWYKPQFSYQGYSNTIPRVQTKKPMIII